MLGRETRFMDEQTRIEVEAAAFRDFVQHLQERTDVQNIDLMNLAGFCRNCLAKWVVAEANQRGVDLSDGDARTMIYGMPYDDWKSKHQTKATDEQMKLYEETKPLHAKISGH